MESWTDKKRKKTKYSETILNQFEIFTKNLFDTLFTSYKQDFVMKTLYCLERVVG